MDASRYAQTLLEVIRVLALLAIAWQVIIVTAMVSKKYREIERLVLVLMHARAMTLIDVDECREEIDGCGQTCSNTAGSYTCNCRTGYRLASDGLTCNGITPVT